MKLNLKTILLLTLLLASVKIFAFPCYAPTLKKINSVSCTSVRIDFVDLIYSDTAWVDVSIDSNFSTFVKYKLIFKTSYNDTSTNFIINGLQQNTQYYFRLGNNLCQKNNYWVPFNRNKGKHKISPIPQSFLNNMVLRDSLIACDSFIAVWTKIPNASFYKARLYRRDSTPAIIFSLLQTKNNLNNNFCTFKGLSPGKTYYWEVEVNGCMQSGSTYLTSKKKTKLGGGKPFAGLNQINIPGLSTTLGASPVLPPNIGTWSILIGEGGNISNTSNPNSIFSGLIGVKYTLMWKSSFPGCDDTDTVDIIFQCGGDIIDSRDNKIYPTLWLNNACWLGKNLDYGYFLNSSSNQLSTGTVFKYCYNNDSANCITDGGLYQWNNLMRGAPIYNITQGICPIGWHVPSESEWTNITNSTTGYTQGQLVVGGSTGFNLIFPGTFIIYQGFQDRNTHTYFYSSGLWCRYMNSFQPSRYPNQYNGDLRNGFSVRCVKN